MGNEGNKGNVMTDQVLTVTLTKYIETRIFEDRPHIRGRRVPVATVAYTARTQNASVEQLMYDFTLSEEQVLAALLYYKEHAEEIDAQEKAEIVAFEEMKRLHEQKRES